MDLHTATLNQLIAHEILTGGEEGDDFLKGHVRLIREVYRERRDAMLVALERHLPFGCTYLPVDLVALR
ncbi:hypothetical protein FBQ96_17005, partial [Nitrospirales bacterium NOB]|nr:hypothetical protein [Nitrospirales bacterium NOB]